MCRILIRIKTNCYIWNAWVQRNITRHCILCEHEFGMSEISSNIFRIFLQTNSYLIYTYAVLKKICTTREVTVVKPRKSCEFRSKSFILIFLLNHIYHFCNKCDIVLLISQLEPKIKSWRSLPSYMRKKKSHGIKSRENEVSSAPIIVLAVFCPFY